MEATKHSFSSLADGVDTNNTIIHTKRPNVDKIDTNLHFVSDPELNDEIENECDNEIGDDEADNISTDLQSPRLKKLQSYCKSFPSPSISNSTTNSYSNSQSTPHITPNITPYLSHSSSSHQHSSQHSFESFNDDIIHENKDEDDEIDQNIQNNLQRTCHALGNWYKQMKNNNYYNKQKGLFSQWFAEEGMQIDEMEEEFDPNNYDDCSYLDFALNEQTKINEFPLPSHIKEDDRKLIQWQIMSYCYKFGTAPSVFSHIANKICRHDLDPFEHDSIDYVIDEDWMHKTAQIYNIVCPKLCGPLTSQMDLIKLFAIGYKHNISLLSLLTDTFMRDRLKYFIKHRHEPITKTLTVNQWALDNIYIKHLVKKYGEMIRTDICSAMQSYITRVLPRFRMDCTTKICDELYDITKHFQAATQFVHKILKEGFRDHKHGGYRISNAPLQFDFCIAVRECSILETEVMVQPQFSDPEAMAECKMDKEPTDQQKYFDIVGDVTAKLKQSQFKYIEQEIDPNKYQHLDYKSLSYVRCYMESYNAFIDKYNIKRDEFPRGSRFCCLIDRRKTITKLRKYDATNPQNNQYYMFNRNDKGHKKDDIFFWIPAKDGCDQIDNKYGIKEIYFDRIATCLIPPYTNCEPSKSYGHYNHTRFDTKYKQLVETITSSSKCNGGLLVFSFHVDAEDEIACYLWWNGQCLRFLPEDIVTVLPEIFVTSPKNRSFVQKMQETDIKAKSTQKKIHGQHHNIINNIKYSDRHFDQFYKKIK